MTQEYRWKVTVKHRADNSTDTFETTQPSMGFAVLEGYSRFPWADEVKAESITERSTK